MNTILVTGGAGFIGSNFIKLLLENTKYNVINFDKLTYAGQGKNIKHMKLDLHKRYEFVKGDICNMKEVKGVMKNVDAIVNFAAESHVDNSIKDSTSFVETNFLGTNVLLQSALENKIQKFVQIGTDEVYGSLKEDAKSSTEENLLNPRNPYSASKASADLLALSFFKTHGLPLCVTRSSNNYGPYQYPEKVIPLFITNLLEEEKIPLYGNGTNIRDWIHVNDNCEGILKVLEKGKAGEIYNIGGGNELSNIILTKKILKEMGFQNYEMIEFVEDRKGHDFRYSLDCSKIENQFELRPEISFEKGLQETIRWYKENESWWRNLK